MKKKMSLMLKIMITVNLATIISILIFSGYLAYTIEKNAEEAAKEQTATLVNSIKLTTADYIWNLNNNALKTIAEKLTSESSVDEVIFYDAKEVELAKSRSDEKEIAEAFKETIVKSDITYGKDNQRIGSVKIMYNLNNVRDMQNKLIVITAIAVLITQSLICIVLFIILRITNKKIIEEFEKLKTISGVTHQSSQDSSEYAQSVSSSTSEQASAIQETVSTLHEITEMVNTSVNSASKSSEKASESYDSAKLGQKVVKEMIDSMKEINESNSSIMNEVNKSNDRIKDIVNVINEISTKTNVINDIVFQTKLLSFNASVEAARAGEHGKGFAVVAEEVGNLAQMSGNAAKEISSLLEQSIARVNQIIDETNIGVEKVIKTGSSKIDQGVKTAEKCDQVLNEIVEIAVVVKNMMNEVAHASKEQAIGVQNISMAMTQVDQMVHANENSANNSFLTAQKLLQKSEELKEAVTNIEIEIFGKSIEENSSKNVKHESSKKVEVKRDEPKKVEVKRDEPKKVEVKREEPKKVEVKKEEPRKVEVKKEAKSHQIETAPPTNSPIPSADDSRFEDI